MSLYIPRKPHDESKASCYPEKPLLVCRLCSRHREGRLPHIDVRQFVVIDASLFAKGGECPMYSARDVAAPFCEPREHEAA
jgi:hypothetical protein